MEYKIKFLPVFSKAVKYIFFILFIVILLIVNFFYVRYKGITIIIFSPMYALFLIIFFYFLSAKYLLILNKEIPKLMLIKPFKKINLDISQINTIEMYELKKSFVISLSYQNKILNFAVSGPLDFEEPQILPFFRNLIELNQNIKLGENIKNIIHGTQTMQVWSNKMYYLYWNYIGAVIFSYIFLLFFIFIINKI